ncbi:MAG: hypothetical protein QOF60_2123 [Actinomycetota bacterium]|nr:hypothetical protein [Actinomycetota bacterium]
MLEFETAGMPSRLLAASIDLVVQMVLVIAAVTGGLGLESLGVGAGALGAVTLYLAFFLILLGYPALLETLWRGRTLGKAALGLRVVTVEGAPIRFRHAAIRSMFALVEKFSLSGLIGIIAILVTRRNQRLGDLVAGTIVLRERSGAGRPQAMAFLPPPGLESYTSSLDVSALGHSDYAAVRGFLLRVGSLTPAARWSLATAIATPLRDRLRTTPPTGVYPETFLACVAAAYQRRNAPAVQAAPAFSSVWSSPSSPPPPPPSTPTDLPPLPR